MKKLLLSTALFGAMAFPALAQDQTIFREAPESLDIRASDFMGMRLYATEAALDGTEAAGVQEGWDDIGEVKDVVLNRDGQVQAVLVDIGGFLGIGERTVAVSMDALEFLSDSETAENANDYFLVINASRDQLENAPAYDAGEQSEMTAEQAAEQTEQAIDEGASNVAAAGAAAGAAASAAAGAAVEATQEAGQAIAETANDAAQATGNAVDNAGDAVADAAGTAAEATENAVEETGEEVAQAGAEVADEVSDAGEEVAEEANQVAMTDTQEDQAEAADTAQDNAEEAAEETAENNAETADEQADQAEAAAEGTAATATAETETAADQTASVATDAAARTPITREGFVAATGEDFTADRLDGAAVYDSNDERVGEVGEIVLNADGQVSDLVIDVGGFLGIGEKPVALPMSSVDILRQDGGDEIRVYVSQTEDQLKDMPKYDEQDQ